MTLFNFWEIKYTVEKFWQQFTEALVETYSLILNGYIYYISPFSKVSIWPRVEIRLFTSADSKLWTSCIPAILL